MKTQVSRNMYMYVSICIYFHILALYTCTIYYIQECVEFNLMNFHQCKKLTRLAKKTIVYVCSHTHILKSTESPGSTVVLGAYESSCHNHNYQYIYG